MHLLDLIYFKALCVFAFVVWCVIGMLICRSRIGLGEGINILAGDGAPKTALALLIAVVLFWPLYLVWFVGQTGWWTFQAWREKKVVKWTFTMPRKTNDLIVGIMQREGIPNKKEYMQRCMGMHDYFTDMRKQGYKFYAKKDDEDEYHELELP
jgi:hypothetical protein